MRYGRFRGKFTLSYNWLFLCTDSCSDCSLCVNGRCCNFYVFVPGKRFFMV